MAVPTQFPQSPTSPIADLDTGRVTVPWQQFFISLWNRTGGATGSLSFTLDSLGQPTLGATLFRGLTVWQPLKIGTDGQVYTVSPLHLPQWESLSSLLDRVVGASPGSLIYRDTIAGWTALSIGVSGALLTVSPVHLPQWEGLSSLLDRDVGSVVGTMLYRDVAWSPLLPGANGQTLGMTGGIPTWAMPPAVSGFVTAPTGTTSVTEVMMGLGSTAGFFVTPIRTGRVVATVTGCVANNTANGGATVTGRFGTGSAPANGVAFTGTQWSTTQHFFMQAARDISGFTVTGGNASLTLGTQYWFDVSISATGGGTATVTDVQGLLFEI